MKINFDFNTLPFENIRNDTKRHETSFKMSINSYTPLYSHTAVLNSILIVWKIRISVLFFFNEKKLLFLIFYLLFPCGKIIE